MKKISIRNKQAGHHRVGEFPVIVQEDISGGYWVMCPPLDGCVSQGETIDEAIKNIREAIELCLEDEDAKGKKIATQRASFHIVAV